MKLSELVKILDLEVKSGADLLDREVTGGYVSDILSDVLTHASPGNIWITRQIHLNIVPISSAQELAGIIIVCSRRPDADTLEKAKAEYGRFIPSYYGHHRQLAAGRGRQYHGQAGGRPRRQPPGVGNRR
jgi:hypothetical protein